MVAQFVNRVIHNNKAFILDQVLEVQGLSRLLMKSWSSGEKWTQAEMRQIWAHLKAISRMVPVIIVFLLPGGSLLVPVLPHVFGQRKGTRPAPTTLPGTDT